MRLGERATNVWCQNCARDSKEGLFWFNSDFLNFGAK